MQSNQLHLREDHHLNTEIVTLREIAYLNDDLLLPWLDLFETAFPPEEKMLVSYFLRLLKQKAAGEEEDTHLLAGVDETGRLVAMIMYALEREARAAYLWYLAVAPDLRGAGIGGFCYRSIVERARQAGMHSMVLEVEIPEEAKTAEAAELARRRICFYQRQGARLLRGIHYIQSVGPHVSPIPMHIMVHPFGEMTPDEAFTLANHLFDESVTKTGELSLD